MSHSKKSRLQLSMQTPHVFIDMFSNEKASSLVWLTYKYQIVLHGIRVGYPTVVKRSSPLRAERGSVRTCLAKDNTQGLKVTKRNQGKDKVDKELSQRSED